MNTRHFTSSHAVRDIAVSEGKFRNIPVGGILPMTTIDFPGKLAAVIFTRGCPWNCRYCHNSLLLRGEGENLGWKNIEEFFRERADFLEGVVLSGGEPTLHHNLPDLLAWLREMGYATALHTNGFFPSMLLHVLRKGLVDFVAMDIKGPPAIYDRVTRTPNTCIEVARSIKLILDSGVNYEFRTTWHPSILSEYELLDTLRAASLVGIRTFYLQRFRQTGVVDQDLTEYATFPQDALDEAKKLFRVFDVR